MPEPAKNVNLEQVELTSERAPTFIKIYSNSANVEATPWDFTIVFGELRRLGPGKLIVDQLVGVTMSPQHAKALAQVLANNVREYEKFAGEIKVPQTESAAPEPQKVASK